MSTAIRAELLKIRTSRLLPGLLAVGIGLTVIAGLVSAGRTGGRIPPLSTAAGLRDVVTDDIFGLVMAAVFGAALTSGEFRHKTATDTYLSEPRRGRVLGAQVIVAGLAGLAFGLAAAVVSTGAGLAFSMGKTTSVPLGAGDLLGFAAGAMLAAGLLAAAGAAVGALVRSQVGAVAAVFVWWIGVELIVAGLSGSVSVYLPFTAGETMAGVRNGGGMPPLADQNALPFAVAAALITGMVIVLTAAAARTTVRRDVT